MYEVVPYCRSIRYGSGNELHWPVRRRRRGDVSQFVRHMRTATGGARCQLLTGKFRLASGLYATTTTAAAATTTTTAHEQGSLAGTAPCPARTTPLHWRVRDRERPPSPTLSLDKSGRRLANGHSGIGKCALACLCPSAGQMDRMRASAAGRSRSKETLGS